MKLLLSLALLPLLAYCYPTDELRTKNEQDATQSKEKNYKAYTAEKEYKVPVKMRILEPFVVGQTIHLIGTLNDKPKRVDFNFHKGADHDADMPLHFSIRFDEGILGSGKLVYNTFQNGNWSESEQRISNPFKAGQEFDLRVRILEDKFQVFANRVEVGTFDQKQPLAGIDHVSIRGDITKVRLFHYGGRIFPMPYTAVVKLVPGQRLDVSGVATGKRVNINLFRENREYALQVSIRFDEGAVVRNAMNNNVWGVEEREGGMPLTKGEVYDVTIINESFSFQIFLNGKRFATFAHRGSPQDVKTVEVDGTTEVQTITVSEAVGEK